jgi:hypothetical protein
MFEHNGKPVEYWNDGDWVEGCNALVEHHDGRMEILHWPEEMKRRSGLTEDGAGAADAVSPSDPAREAA